MREMGNETLEHGIRRKAVIRREAAITGNDEIIG